MAKRRRTAKFRRLLEAYKGEAKLNASEAARIAGYGDPRRAASEMKRRYPEDFAKAEEELRESMTVSAQELDGAITNLVRTPKHKDHFRAVELLCRIHGRLTDKVNVTLDKGVLNSQLDELIKLMLEARARARSIPVQAIEVALLQNPPEQPTQDDNKPS